MAEVIIQSYKSALISKKYPNDHFTVGATHQFDYDRGTEYVLIGFDGSPASAYQFKKIDGIELYLYGHSRVDGVSASVSNGHLWRTFDPDTVTYNSAQTASNWYPFNHNGFSSTSGGWSRSSLKSTEYYLANSIISNGIHINGGRATIHTSLSGNKPYIRAFFNSQNACLYSATQSPSSGYVAKTKANTFTWSIDYSGWCLADLAITSAKFQWRVTGQSTINEINCGTASTCTVPAYTFNADSIDWRVVTTDNGGTTNTRQWHTLSTVEAIPTVSCASPRSVMLDGSVAQTFSWNYTISTGTSPTASQLQYSTNGTSWATLANVSGSATSVTVSAGFFTSGQKYWRVRSANTDSAYSAWSEAATFTIVSAPPTPSVTSETNPRPIIRWQSSDQQGYEVQIDDYSTGSMYGTANSFQCPFFLEEGSHTIKVRVVNQYGLWSSYGTAGIVVTNVPQAPITLTGTGGKYVHLTWSSTYSYATYIVYRDGEAIAKIINNYSNSYYTDYLTVGTHEYTVRGVPTSSPYYRMSNAVSVTASVDKSTIYDIDANVWLDIPYSTSTISSVNLDVQSDAVQMMFSQNVYPVIEMSKHRSKTISLMVAFTNKTDAATLESMFCHTVCLKTSGDEMVIGVLTSYGKERNQFYSVYNITLSQIEYKETVTL